MPDIVTSIRPGNVYFEMKKCGERYDSHEACSMTLN